MLRPAEHALAREGPDDMILFPDTPHNLAGRTRHPAGQPAASHEPGPAQSWHTCWGLGSLSLRWPSVTEELPVRPARKGPWDAGSLSNLGMFRSRAGVPRGCEHEPEGSWLTCLGGSLERWAGRWWERGPPTPETSASLLQ